MQLAFQSPVYTSRNTWQYPARCSALATNPKGHTVTLFYVSHTLRNDQKLYVNRFQKAIKGDRKKTPTPVRHEAENSSVFDCKVIPVAIVWAEEQFHWLALSVWRQQTTVQDMGSDNSPTIVLWICPISWALDKTLHWLNRYLSKVSLMNLEAAQTCRSQTCGLNQLTNENVVA
jgi:hypothetical protein